MKSSTLLGRWSQFLPAALCVALLMAFRSAGQTVARHAYPQIVCTRFASDDAAIPSPIREALAGQPKMQVRDARRRLWQASSNGLIEIDPSGKKRTWTGKDGLPVLSLSGISHLEFQPFDLERKSKLFIERLQSRHNRYGYTADCDLLRPGDPSSYRLAPSDNDGLWTAIYVASECFRFGVTHSPEALHNARVSLEALERLESITGIPGFPARALTPRHRRQAIPNRPSSAHPGSGLS